MGLGSLNLSKPFQHSRLPRKSKVICRTWSRDAPGGNTFKYNQESDLRHSKNFADISRSMLIIIFRETTNSRCFWLHLCDVSSYAFNAWILRYDLQHFGFGTEPVIIHHLQKKNADKIIIHAGLYLRSV